MIKLNIKRFGSTNKTTHYELSQFVSSDKPSWLNDINSDMSKIDTAINTAKTTADGAATSAGNAQTTAEGAQTTANTAVTNAAAAQTTANGAVTNIGDLANLQTINKTNLVTAINELIQPAGTIIAYAGSTAPDGYMLCDGSAVSRSIYSKLFTAIGTTYGTGDGSTTFNVPNLKGKVVVGYNSSDSDFNSLGNTGGEKTHTLTVNEIPSHDHDIRYSLEGVAHSGSGNNLVGKQNTGDNWDVHDSLTGGGQAHNNLQPYIVLNYIIKY